jgi:GNAT superfamily N-acetyltransferase
MSQEPLRDVFETEEYTAQFGWERRDTDPAFPDSIAVRIGEHVVSIPLRIIGFSGVEKWGDLYIYRENGVPLGVLKVARGKLSAIAVIPPKQRQGIAQQLFAAAQADGIKISIQDIATRTITKSAVGAIQKFQGTL